MTRSSTVPVSLTTHTPHTLGRTTTTGQRRRSMTPSACRRSHRGLGLLLLAALALVLAVLLPHSQAADPNKPQGHKGMVKPFKPGPPGIKLKGGDLEKLRKGEAVKQQLSAGSGGRGLVIQDVHAPPEVVWGRILDFPAYTRMVPRVTICENYKTQEHFLEGMKEIFTRMRLTVMGFHVEYFIQHKYYPKLNTVVWTLDYARESDLDDSVGYWHVIPHPDPDREHWSRVYYSIDMRLKSWMPSFVKNVLKNQALTQATSWVKKESEKIGVPARLRRKSWRTPEPPNLQEGLREAREGWCRRFKDATECISKRLPRWGGNNKEVTSVGKPAGAKK